MVYTSPATHLSYRQWSDRARGARNLDRGTSNRAQRKEVKTPVWKMIEEIVERITVREITQALPWEKQRC